MNIHLHIPGLMAAPARLVQMLELPALAALRQWRTHAAVHPIPPGRFGFHARMLNMQKPPIAALAWLAATGERPARQVFLATPVHLQAGMSDLVLFTGRHFSLEDAERDALFGDAAEFFGEEPRLQVVEGAAFLQPPRPLEVITTPLQLAQGEGVRANLPRGKDAPVLHAWMNELQMFLHGHAVNRMRADTQRPPINGLWIWGEGALPAAERGNLHFHGNTLFIRGLACLRGRFHALPADFTRLTPDAVHVVELTDCQDALDADDIDAWRRAVEALTDEWLAPVLNAVKAGGVESATLYPGDGAAYDIDRRAFSRWKFWRREIAPHLVTES